jgi:hypothetical protein
MGTFKPPVTKPGSKHLRIKFVKKNASTKKFHGKSRQTFSWKYYIMPFNPFVFLLFFVFQLGHFNMLFITYEI